MESPSHVTDSIRGICGYGLSGKPSGNINIPLSISQHLYNSLLKNSQVNYVREFFYLGNNSPIARLYFEFLLRENGPYAHGNILGEKSLLYSLLPELRAMLSMVPKQKRIIPEVLLIEAYSKVH